MSDLDQSVHLIGGEAMACSDAEHAAGGAALELLAGAYAGAETRVLLAGPHTTALTDALADRCAAVTCLVRSHADARALARRHERNPRVRVLCGSLDAFTPGAGHDLVLALGGLSRLHSPDGARLTWQAALDRLTGAVAGAGVLLLGVENPLGAHRLTAAGGLPAPDPAEPVGHNALVAWLREAGLHVAPSYAAFAEPARPTVLARTPELDAASGTVPLLAAEAAAAFGAATRRRPLLDDPRRLAGAALRAGMGAQLAPAWIVAAGRQPVCPREPLPPAFVAGGAHAAHWDTAVAYERADDGQWSRRLLSDSGATLRLVGRVTRMPELLTGRVAPDRTLADLLLAACAEHDLPAVRRLLRGYADWLAGSPPSGHLAFATCDNVLTDGTRHELLDPSWHLSAPIPMDEVLARALRGFAVTLLTAGLPHPWPASLDVESLTVSLAAAAGRPLTREAVRAAVALECEIQAARWLLPEQAEQELRCELGTVTARHTALAARDWRAMTGAMDRLAAELAEARDEIAWWEERVRASNREHERHLHLYQNSRSFMVGRAVTAPLRLARQTVRRVSRSGK
ncbi:hypothetical protein J2S43_006312 [Catenuloplanes nepalensis]|uniref:Uncharacterized protein n=1 Tax=Catenuloplanes nepalensis TaxID=587533 RepID=A0ABT9N295_9ACTN|nr:hypothetical protein [Catenuloplanes nepalensis]MDP9797800.1 hypothetical protein [Catenuloplanes nepalensis]